jgi:hypothetical protein
MHPIRFHIGRIASVLTMTGCGLLTSGVVHSTQPDIYDGLWHYEITPYVWLPTIYGNLDFDLPSSTRSTNVQINPGSYFSNLQFAGMATGQARHGNWAFLFDVVIANLSNSNAQVRNLEGPNGNIALPINTDVHTKVTSSVFSLAASYTLTRGSRGSIDAYAGIRFVHVDASLDWSLSGPLGLFQPTGHASQTASLTNGIVGVQGKLWVSNDGSWYMPYALDVGVGSGSWSWNLVIGIGRQYRWGDVVLGYRNLYYDTSDHRLLQNVRLTGPALGATFRW